MDEALLRPSCGYKVCLAYHGLLGLKTRKFFYSIDDSIVIQMEGISSIKKLHGMEGPIYSTTAKHKL